MADTNMFLFSTVAQVNYFSQVGRLIAERNYNQSKLQVDNASKKENAICIHISISYGENADILSAIRRAWHISEQRSTAPAIKCLFAVKNNVIVGVYEYAKDDKKIVSSYEKGRRELNLSLARLEYQLNYLGKPIDIEFSQQPVRYVYVAELD